MTLARAIPVSSATPQPWRNGGGRTRELHAWPADRDWRVRVSVADVDCDGPFSAYPGVTRWFVVVEGAGVELAFDDARRRIVRGDPPSCFDGGKPPHCRLLDGPTRDLNLMLRGVDGAMLPASDHRPWSPAGRACGLYAATAGVCHAGLMRERVDAHTLLWFDVAPAVLRFAADADDGGSVGWWLQHSAERSG